MMTGYRNNIDEAINDTSNEISVNSAGHYRLLRQSSFYTIRPKGRIDYQLLYIAKGRALFNIKGEKKWVSEGHVCIYYPNERQEYWYQKEDDPSIYWIHFTGSKVEQIIRELDVKDTRIVSVQLNNDYNYLFDKIIEELQSKRPLFLRMIQTYFQQILWQMIRINSETSVRNGVSDSVMEQAVYFFNKNYMEDIQVNEYAHEQNITPCWFIRSFKKYTSFTPQEYITQIRLNKAKELLKISDYNVSEIASIVGYKNPCYFSRIFSRKIGLSPINYRKKSS